MPGLAQRNDHPFSNAKTTSSLSTLSCSNGSVAANVFWSKHPGHVGYNQAQKFWSELSPQARQELLTIDKQTLFEQARKNMYCARCIGLLLEGFLQIVLYGKSLQQEGKGGHLPCNRPEASKIQHGCDFGMFTGCQDDIQDPSLHPWGGLTTTRNAALTLLDCYLHSKSLKRLQNVFDSAHARERERELLYPDACGGGGRGWKSQGMAGYGRGHGARETCALHTARLSVDTLVDFWSALGEETQQSLLRIKEEDFIERLMYRFDSKRFCRDCRRNVIREFKELKELKRMRWKPCCTSWFCVADTAFQYEVSHDKVQADWHQTFTDTVGTYHQFEWAVGTGEGKSDIREFENVGMSEKVQVNGLDLNGLNACYITLRAWKMDGGCSELSVKAHALKGQECVHCRLVVGDGFVTITRGESIRKFFEHAKEAEEEEDDDSIDKGGNEPDGECSRPQKHAKSPELAREFLLDAATIIFKEQVEKAFREGTARQNAHSIFVCLALKLLEERVHIACKDIITLEKQMKLLEEEEKEKREEEERKERKRTKEREKKLRRKERLRGKEKDRENKSSESSQSLVVPDVLKEETSPSVDDESSVICNRDSVCETGDSIPSRPPCLDIQDEQPLNGMSNTENFFDDGPEREFSNMKDGNGSFTADHSKIPHQKLKFRKESILDSTLKWSGRQQFAVVSESGVIFSRNETRYHGDDFEISSRGIIGLNKNSRNNVAKSNIRNGGLKFSEKFHCSRNRISDRYDFHSCSCKQHNDYRAKVEPHVSTIRMGWKTKSTSKSESALDMSKSYSRSNKYNQGYGRPKSKIIARDNPSTRNLPHIKKVWEPLSSQKYPQSNSDSDVTFRSSTFKTEDIELNNLRKSSDGICSGEVTGNLDASNHKDNNIEASYFSEKPINSTPEMDGNFQNPFHVELKASHFPKKAVNEEVELCPITTFSSKGTTDPPMSSSSNSDNCSLCLREGDRNTAFSTSPNLESFSASDSEDASQHPEGRETVCTQNVFSECHEVGMEKMKSTYRGGAFKIRGASGFSPVGAKSNFPGILPTRTVQNPENGKTNVSMGSQHQGILPPMHNQSTHFPMFQAPSMLGYYHQNPASWPAAPANGLMPFTHPNHHVFASPSAYNLNRNSCFMQFGALQQLTGPLLNPGQLPVYLPVARANGMNSKEQTKFCKAGGVQVSGNEINMERMVSTRQLPVEARANGEGGPHRNTDKSHMGSSSFSLFHFSDPLALSTGYKSNPIPSKEGVVGNSRSNLSADHVEGDCASDKKDTIEEYHLFAMSNGIRFSS